MSFPDLNMVKHRLKQIIEADTAPPGFLGAEWCAQDALFWLTGDPVYAERADEIAVTKAKS